MIDGIEGFGTLPDVIVLFSGAGLLDLEVFAWGAAAFLVAFLMAGFFAVLFKIVYQWVTPYHEAELIRQGNKAAAITLGGALLGYVIALASALSQTNGFGEFAAWAALSGSIQILAFLVISKLAFKGFVERIEKGETAAALYMAAVSICIGVLNAACMTA